MNRWLIYITIGAIMAAAIFGFWGASQLHRANEEARLLQEERDKSEALIDALVQVQLSNEREKDRLDRAIQNIERYRNAPVTTGCGPVVHDAIERLRDE